MYHQCKSVLTTKKHVFLLCNRTATNQTTMYSSTTSTTTSRPATTTELTTHVATTRVQEKRESDLTSTTTLRPMLRGSTTKASKEYNEAPDELGIQNRSSLETFRETKVNYIYMSSNETKDYARPQELTAVWVAFGMLMIMVVGIAYKHMRDKMKKEKEMQKEDNDYLKSKMNPTQIANIKKVWQHKTKKDVTPAVVKMIKDMDIPTQLAIKHAKINQLSKLVEEAFAVQITKKDGGKLIHGKYKDKAAADKFVKWYKTGDMKDTKSIEVVKEMAKDKAYAIGMATAKKKYNDEPPLDKKTIKKAHEIGDKLSKMKKENKDHPAREVYEQIKGLKNKAEKSGMPYGILKKVYDRGMAAWRGGHRPGTTQQQWAFARVNSFVTKSSGTWGGADKDLAAKVKGN